MLHLGQSGQLTTDNFEVTSGSSHAANRSHHTSATTHAIQSSCSSFDTSSLNQQSYLVKQTTQVPAELDNSGDAQAWRILVFNARQGAEVSELKLSDFAKVTADVDPAWVKYSTPVEQQQLLCRFVSIMQCVSLAAVTVHSRQSDISDHSSNTAPPSWQPSSHGLSISISLMVTLLPTWKKYVVTPFLKKSSLDKENLSDYRPICSLSILSKITEHIVKYCPTDHLTQNQLLNTYQPTHRKQHSTETTPFPSYHLINATGHPPASHLSLSPWSVCCLWCYWSFHSTKSSVSLVWH